MLQEDSSQDCKPILGQGLTGDDSEQDLYTKYKVSKELTCSIDIKSSFFRRSFLKEA